MRFGVEPTGRYGGIGLELDGSIEVDCLEINDVLERVLEREPAIDVLKLDTEGLELATVQGDPAGPAAAHRRDLLRMARGAGGASRALRALVREHHLRAAQPSGYLSLRAPFTNAL